MQVHPFLNERERAFHVTSRQLENTLSGSYAYLFYNMYLDLHKLFRAHIDSHQLKKKKKMHVHAGSNIV